MNRLICSVVLVLGLMCSANASELQRQHGAHVHGQASGSLALDQGRVYLELEIPGANLVGFEHPPRNDDQADALTKVIEALENGQWLMADPGGQCQMGEITVSTRGFGHSSAGRHDHDDDHGHDHHHGHDHKHEKKDKQHHDHESHEHHDHDHAEFHVRARLDCQSPGQLRWLDLGLFDDYPGNERMTIDVLTDTLATRVRLTPGRQRIDLDS